MQLHCSHTTGIRKTVTWYTEQEPVLGLYVLNAFLGILHISLALVVIYSRTDKSNEPG
jgi:hypothetical protein